MLLNNKLKSAELQYQLENLTTLLITEDESYVPNMRLSEIRFPANTMW